MKEKHQIVEVCVKEVDKHWLRRGGILVEKNKQITDNILKKINIITDSKDSDENLINIIYTIKKETKKNCRFSERFTMWWGFCYIRDYIIQNNIETRYEDETIWLTQKLMGELFEVGTNTINYHLKEIFKSAEIAKNKAESEFEKYRVVQDRLFESDFDKLIMMQLKNGND